MGQQVFECGFGKGMIRGKGVGRRKIILT